MKRLVLPFASVLALVGCNGDTTDLFGSGGAASSTSSSPTGSTSTSMSSVSSSSTASGSMTTSASSTGSGTTTSSGPASCGDGIVNQPNEQCDGADLAGHACTDVGFVEPDGATCDDQCQLVFDACSATCGNGTTEPTEACDDGNMIDTDGCSGQCVVQGDCMTPIAIALDFGTIDVAGSTTGGTNAVTSMNCQEATGPERVYRITPLHPGFLTVWTDPIATDFDAMVYARNMGCGGNADLACGDNNASEPDLISFMVGDAMQPITVIVDGYQQQAGDFVVHFDLSTGLDCSDPVPILVGDDMGFPQRVTGSTFNAGANELGVCGGASNDIVYQVTRLAPGSLLASTTSNGNLNSVTYARDTCTDGGSQIACDSPTGTNNSSITFGLDQDPVFVIVDGIQTTQGGYSLSFDPTP